MADAPTAAMLLHPFRIDDLDHGHADSFGKMAGRYGQWWTAEQVRTWFAGRPGWTYVGGPERPRWIADQLPGLCARLQASGPGGAVAAQQLVELAWEWTAKDIAADAPPQAGRTRVRPWSMPGSVPILPGTAGRLEA